MAWMQNYYFKVNGIDANDDPTGGVASNTVHIITVAKDQYQRHI